METPLCHSAVPEHQQTLFSGRFAGKLNGKNSNLQVATIQQPFLFGRLPTEELACRKKQDYTEKGNQHPPCVCLWNRRNGRSVIFDLPILVTVVLAVVAVAVVRARER
jgi:hypothetical protein